MEVGHPVRLHFFITHFSSLATVCENYNTATTNTNNIIYCTGHPEASFFLDFFCFLKLLHNFSIIMVTRTTALHSKDLCLAIICHVLKN